MRALQDPVIYVESRVQFHADVSLTDVYKMTGLHHAAMRGNQEIVSFLAKSYPHIINCKDIQVVEEHIGELHAKLVC